MDLKETQLPARAPIAGGDSGERRTAAAVGTGWKERRMRLQQQRTGEEVVAKQPEQAAGLAWKE